MRRLYIHTQYIYFTKNYTGEKPNQRFLSSFWFSFVVVAVVAVAAVVVVVAVVVLAAVVVVVAVVVEGCRCRHC